MQCTVHTYMLAAFGRPHRAPALAAAQSKARPSLAVCTSPGSASRQPALPAPHTNTAGHGCVSFHLEDERLFKPDPWADLLYKRSISSKWQQFNPSVWCRCFRVSAADESLYCQGMSCICTFPSTLLACGGALLPPIGTALAVYGGTSTRVPPAATDAPFKLCGAPAGQGAPCPRPAAVAAVRMVTSGRAGARGRVRPTLNSAQLSSSAAAPLRGRAMAARHICNCPARCPVVLARDRVLMHSHLCTGTTTYYTVY